MARGDGIRYGAGGKPMTTLKEVVGESNETEIKPIPKKKEEKKTQVLEERILDVLPSDDDSGEKK
jgi:hypothetical protein